MQVFVRGTFSKWFRWYNEEHRYTGLNLHTPASVHFGTVEGGCQKTPNDDGCSLHTPPGTFCKRKACGADESFNRSLFV